MPDAIDDILDSIRWTRENLGQLTGTQVDIDRYGLIGDSAGGGHALVVAARLQPPPKVLVDIYGVADMLDPAFNLRPRPDDITNDQEVIEGYSLKSIRAGISHDPSESITSAPYGMELPVGELRAAWEDDTFEYTQQRRLQWAIKKYADTYKLYTWLCFRREDFEPGVAGEEAFEKHVKEYNGIDVVKRSSEYPPTFILQGTGDTRVPASVSERLASTMREKGFMVEENYEPGGEHGYDTKYQVGRGGKSHHLHHPLRSIASWQLPGDSGDESREMDLEMVTSDADRVLMARDPRLKGGTNISSPRSIS
jgi:acetyl esterase/lipase